MRFNCFTFAAMLGVIGTFTTLSAQAQFTTTAGAPSGNLILGFNLPGNNTDYEVDLGSFSLYTGNSQIYITNVGADLSAIYGSNWFSNPSLAVGFGGAIATSALVSDPTRVPFSVVNANIPIADFSSLGVAENAVPSPTPGSTPGSLEVNTANVDNISFVLANGGFPLIESGAFFNGTTAPALYLDILSLSGAKATHLANTTVGTNPFTIESNGDIIYDAAPEPSTYAVGLASLIFLLALKRRSSGVRG